MSNDIKIDKQKLERIIEEVENSLMHFPGNVVADLKDLIEPEKWEPKNIASFSQGMHDKYYAMEERNRRIFLAKAELEEKPGRKIDGDFSIAYGSGIEEWMVCKDMGLSSNPEITFDTKEQADEVIKMVGLNDNK